MNVRFYLFPVLLFLSNMLYAQGEDCDLSLYLPNVNNYCSNPGQYTNVGSTPGAFSIASCWGATQTEDVWFSFIATGTDVLISASGNGSDGTITNPRIALFSGSCSGMLTELGCNNSPTNDVADLYESAMIVGQTYYIRVSTTNANEGTFKLCVNSYSQPISPGADCSGAAYLCDKSPVSNASFSGGGANMFEPEFTSCMSIENNSVWYYWQCSTSGTFTFDITPSNLSNDIDYIFYQLNTSNPCGPRTVLRCNTSACMNATGSTGLSASDFDISEDPGCDPGENAYCSQVNLVAGQYYALLIDNATSNAGFSLAFGGTSQFTGPDPNFTNTSLVICEGQTVTFDGATSTNVPGGLAWVFSTGSSPTSATGAGPHTVTYATAGNYVAILTGTDATGCQDVQTANITVNACGCSVTASNSGNVCAGTSTFDLSSTTVTGATYSWTGPGGFTAATQNPTGVVVPAAPGTYSYTVTADDGTQTCTSTTTLTVYALPTITAPLTTLCVGTSTTLTGSGTAASSSAWVSSSTGVATVNTSGTVNAVSTGTTTITYTDNHACTATQTMTVVANPTASISGSTTVCSGGSANISFSGTPSATVTYQINGGTNQTIVLDATGNASLPSGNLSATTTFTMVSVQVSPPSGCSATISGSATITVGNPPTVDPLNAIEICLNESVTVPAFSSTPTGATFAWTNDNTTIGLGANGTGNVSSFTSIASGVANISVVPTLNGCVGPAMVFTITVNPLPTADAGTDASFCEGESTTIGVASSSGNTYSWSPSNGLSSTTSSNPTVSNLSEGVYNYTVTITDASGCVATDVVDVTVMPTPIAQFSVNPTVVTLEDPSVTTENTSIDALTYFWNFGDGFTSTQINPAHVFPQVAGVFPITLTATNGTCVDSITHVVEISEQLILYVPNAFTPDGDEYNNVFLPILNEAYDYQNYTFDVFNRWGELIFTSNNPLVGWDGTYHGKLCKEGQYIWRIEVKRKNKDEHFIYTGHINLLY